jgi:diguanylate cyclase (GGDEF)-like protein
MIAYRFNRFTAHPPTEYTASSHVQRIPNMHILHLRTFLSDKTGVIDRQHRNILVTGAALAIATGVLAYGWLAGLLVQPVLASFMATCMAFFLAGACLLITSLDIAFKLQKQAEAENAYLLGLQGKLFDKANYDGLTGLPNRRLIDDRFRLAVQRARRNRRSFAFYTVKLSQFDRLEPGDMMADQDNQLLAIAGKLSDAVRKSDTVVRLGKGDFVLIVESIRDPLVLLAVTEKILTSIGQGGQLVREGDGPCPNTLGLAIFPNDGDECAQLAEVAQRTICDRRTLKGLLAKMNSYEWGDFWATNENW